ncbi:MAG: class I SAM-dependent methyltransferase [Flavobacteriaceae bacterium]
MKKALDNFSRQAETYKRFRPTYPPELYKEILQYVKERKTCWDCATGNGQVAQELSKYFSKVYATDLSQKQLDQAEQQRNIVFKKERSERTGFKDDQFDLITVAQAIHWFDMETFNKEVRRVSKPGGIIAVWGYGLLRPGEKIDTLLREFYSEIVGPYWNKERKHLDNKYESILFDFDPINEDKERNILVNWTLNAFEGYLNSWSSVQHYIQHNKGENPVIPFIEKIKPLWGNKAKRPLKFPLYLKVGRIEK